MFILSMVVPTLSMTSNICCVALCCVLQPGVFDYSPADVVPVLDKAQSVIETCVAELGIQARLIRKERAVGIIPKVPGHRLKREALDETAYAVSSALKKQFLNVPFCSFNGGNDVFVDIGDKSIGIRGLLKLTGIAKEHCLHVGDQFFSHGNDYACRLVLRSTKKIRFWCDHKRNWTDFAFGFFCNSCKLQHRFLHNKRDTCATIWITSPKETAEVLDFVISEVCDCGLFFCLTQLPGVTPRFALPCPASCLLIC